MGLDYFVNCTKEPHFAHKRPLQSALYPFNSPGVCALGELIRSVLQMLNLFILNFVPINSLKQKGLWCLFKKKKRELWT